MCSQTTAYREEIAARLGQKKTVYGDVSIEVGFPLSSFKINVPITREIEKIERPESELQL